MTTPEPFLSNLPYSPKDKRPTKKVIGEMLQKLARRYDKKNHRNEGEGEAAS